MSTNILADSVTALFADDLNQHALSTPAIELAIEDLFPRTEIEFAGSNRYDYFAAHDLPFQVRIGVIFAGAIVPVAGDRRVRGELLQPEFVVVVQTRFVVVDED